MELSSLIVLIVVIIVGWFFIRQIISAITCGVRFLLFVIIAVAILYVVGSTLNWPIIDVLNEVISNFL
ncbi:MAG: hypothetical protein AAF702_02750 [Chloroflexota bacterium]